MLASVQTAGNAAESIPISAQAARLHRMVVIIWERDSENWNTRSRQQPVLSETTRQVPMARVLARPSELYIAHTGHRDGGQNSEAPVPLLQFRVLRLGFFQDRYVWIGIFPKCEKGFISGKSSDAGGIGIRALRSSSLGRIRSR